MKPSYYNYVIENKNGNGATYEEIGKEIL